MSGFSKTVSGALSRNGTATFTNPLIKLTNNSPDPWIINQAGFYYFCAASTDNCIWVWKATTISGIERGEKVKVWQGDKKGSATKQVWAPELHFLEGKWYIYYAASNGLNANHRMYVLEALSNDPLGPYQELGQLGSPENKWAIDGTVLHYADAYYFLWSGWPESKDGLQNIYIAPMSDPCKISGPRVLLSTPEYSWEGWINEGPQILQRQGRLYMIYSANASWTKDYCLGMLTYQGGPRDVLEPDYWAKSSASVFQQGNDVYCVGHCSFTKSPDGSEDWILYHGKSTPAKSWRGRQTRAQPFSWSSEGRPEFGLPLPSGESIAVPSGE